ncbi:MAG: general secretion pathway protein GspK [Burkholderiaceae bacterium]|nr:MAG: general secretion pathway protein GspK [Burkholderiaceae bacterium]
MTRGGTSNREHQRGAALLLALITVVLVATFASAALWRSWRGVEVESAERARIQASWILTGALDWARLILMGDLSEGLQHPPVTDNLTEPWAVPLAEARLSTFLDSGAAGAQLDRNAFLSGQISDLQARLNVMNLTLGTADQQAEARARFERLFQAIGVSGNVLDTLQQGLINAQKAAIGASQNDAPLLPVRFDQLAWLGVDPGTLLQLKPYVTVLPLQNNQPTPVNLNTADAEVIYAALPDLDLTQAQQLVALRNQRPFTTVANALAQINVTPQHVDWASVSTGFFELKARLRIDDVVVEEMAAVQRSNGVRGPMVVLLWRTHSALTLPTDRAPG